jgi:hypothetical protein
VSIFAALKETPAPLSKASRFTWMCGAFYMAAGALVMAWPGAAQVLMGDPDFVGHEAALMRVLGMCVLVIGWLYFFGGRSGGRQVVAATIVDRIVLVPLVLVPTAMAGVLPHTLLLFAVTDPALAIVAWLLLARHS